MCCAEGPGGRRAVRVGRLTYPADFVGPSSLDLSVDICRRRSVRFLCKDIDEQLIGETKINNKKSYDFPSCHNSPSWVYLHNTTLLYCLIF